MGSRDLIRVHNIYPNASQLRQRTLETQCAQSKTQSQVRSRSYTHKMISIAFFRIERASRWNIVSDHIDQRSYRREHRLRISAATQLELFEGKWRFFGTRW